MLGDFALKLMAYIGIINRNIFHFFYSTLNISDYTISMIFTVIVLYSIPVYLLYKNTVYSMGKVFFIDMSIMISLSNNGNDIKEKVNLMSSFFIMLIAINIIRKLQESYMTAIMSNGKGFVDDDY